jgi:hypothetical protein
LRQADGPSASGLARIDLPNVFAEVLRLWMVYAVHPQSIKIVVNGDIHMPPSRIENAGAETTPSGEIDDDQFSIEIEDELGAHQLRRMMNQQKTA